MASMLKPVFCTSTCRRHTLSLPKQVAISENKYAIVNRKSSSYATAKKAASYASMKVSNNMRGHVILNALSGSPRVDEIVKEANSMLLKTRRSPPHWFTPSECENPPPNAPLLLYLPGIDGTGFGMALHHQALGELFEVQCLHIPYTDRTSFEGILSMVDSRIKLEHRKAPSRPLYILGECLGGCIGLATAANNPDIDLSLILVNPGSCFSKSVLWPWFTMRKMLTEDLYSMLPFRVDESLVLAKSLPRESLLWRFRMLQSAESHIDSVLQLVKHDILLIASGKDQLLPSRDEAFHLNKLLENCKIRYFKNAGHCILLEEDFSLTAVIKSVSFYRRSRLHDYVDDCLLPTREELKTASEIIGLVKKSTSPVLLSTNEHGQIVKGLDGIPGKGPVLFVGNHMLTGIEVLILVTEFFRERQIFLRGLAHPLIFSNSLEADLQKPNINDLVRLCGAVPVSGRNLFKLLSSKSHVLLYPGGLREALHSKGQQYKLLWPEKAEFVRMAAQFEATIVPFGAVGEDDMAEVIFGYEELSKIPYYSNMVKRWNEKIGNTKNTAPGNVVDHYVHPPFILPKFPGRMYFLLGKPIPTAGRKVELKDKESAQAVYSEIKKEVETSISYLLEKREHDPYRHFLPRFAKEAFSDFTVTMPTFDV